MNEACVKLEVFESEIPIVTSVFSNELQILDAKIKKFADADTLSILKKKNSTFRDC